MVFRTLFLFMMLSLSTFAAAREPVATSKFFEFYNTFETNLNDALLAAGVERNFERQELFQSGEEEACFDALAPSLKAGWDLAVDYYARLISPHDFDDRQQALIRLQLSGDSSYSLDENAVQFLELAANFRAAAAPVYRACRWESQAVANMSWINSLKPQLDRFEEAIAARLAYLYQMEWPSQPLGIDVVSTVSWAGANSFFGNDGKGHILVSSTSQIPEALEIVFHEASHGFMLRGSPLQEALGSAADELGVQVPGGLWHVLLFVTTGETVREIVVASGAADYDPMIIEIYERSPWGSYANAVAEIWPRYLHGELTAEAAATELIATIDAQNGEAK